MSQPEPHVHGTALQELASFVRVCLEEEIKAFPTIQLIEECCAMGAAKYPLRWIPLDPRIHYFTNFDAALANALLWVPPELQEQLQRDEVPLKNLLLAVSKMRSSDGDYYNYAVVVGLTPAFSYSTVGSAMAAAHADIEELGRDGLGF